jgi:hypothetical protein
MSDEQTSLGDDAFEALDPDVEQALAESLRAAYSPTELSPALNEVLIAQALEDPLAEATDEEVRESERLRDALAGEGQHADAALAEALRSAAHPAPLAELSAERLVRRSIPRAPKRRNLPLLVTGATAVLALAASVALVVRSSSDSPSGQQLAREAKALVQSRSTAALFPAKFEPGQASQRIDRIATARERDLRENRFALWGVQ